MTGATTGLRVHLYRYRHPDGAEKDWAYPVRLAPNALTVFYGRTGAALRQADTPTLHCRGCNPATEVQARVQEKLAKGYRGLGEFWLAADRRQLTPAAPVGPPAAPALAPPPAAEPPPPCWYWRWTPGPVPPPRLAAVEAACTAAEVGAQLFGEFCLLVGLLKGGLFGNFLLRHKRFFCFFVSIAQGLP